VTTRQRTLKKMHRQPARLREREHNLDRQARNGRGHDIASRSVLVLEDLKGVWSARGPLVRQHGQKQAEPWWKRWGK
jgi:hypothetical protein